jgi:hypothetical protein
MISQLLLVLHRRAMMVGNLECLGFYSAHVTHPCPQFKISSQSSVDSASNKAVTIVFDNDFTLDGYRVNGADCLGVYFGVKRVATCRNNNDRQESIWEKQSMLECIRTTRAYRQ